MEEACERGREAGGVEEAAGGGEGDGGGYGGRRVARWTRESLGWESLWSEASGALGDMGTLLPLLTALTLTNGLDLGTTLLAMALSNIATGLLFGIPMPVQPMKSIAAAAIVPGSLLSVPQIMAAGIITSAVALLLGLTGLIRLAHRLTPLPVVRGIQLSQGLSFGITAAKYVLRSQDLAAGKSLGPRPWLGSDGLLLALAAFCFIVLATGSGDRLMAGSGPESSPTPPLLRKFELIPTAVIVFLVGLALAFVRDPTISKGLSLGPSKPQLVRISAHDWKEGFVRGAIPQIPLTLLNSVIAVCKLASDLFPDRPVSPTIVSVSVGVMNLVGCWFGAMPVCHGAGGLAGQCRFGARSGMAVVMLGAAKLAVALTLGSSLVVLLRGFPVALLGILLLFAGLELAMACRDQATRADAFVVLVSAAVSLGSSNAALGFGCSLVAFLLLKSRDAGVWSRFRMSKERLHGYCRRCCCIPGSGAEAGSPYQASGDAPPKGQAYKAPVLC